MDVWIQYLRFDFTVIIVSTLVQSIIMISYMNIGDLLFHSTAKVLQCQTELTEWVIMNTDFY